MIRWLWSIWCWVVGHDWDFEDRSIFELVAGKAACRRCEWTWSDRAKKFG